jgi:hypothetical protein
MPWPSSPCWSVLSALFGYKLAEQYNCQHRQVDEEHRDPPHLGKAVRDVIPTPDTGSPTQAGGEKNLAARLGNKP